jgi:two-component system LytT family sensor kinase
VGVRGAKLRGMTPLPTGLESKRDGGSRNRVAILLVVWTVPAVCMVLQMYATAIVNRTPAPPPRALIPAVAEWLIWVPLTPAIIWLARRYPVTWPPSLTSVLVHALGIGAAAVVRATVYATATFVIGTVAAHVTFGGYLWRIALAWLPIAALVWGGMLAAGAALDYAGRLRDREIHDVALREQLARAELGALRARLHPHFLFNALHSVGALVRGGDNAMAVRVIAQLSELLRDVVAGDAPEMVRLRDELAFVRRYLDIEGVRFADRLRVEWEVEDSVADAVVPSLVVQPLVENAMRHAISATWDASRVRISARREGAALAIEVSDDGPGIGARVRERVQPTRGGGVGLADTRTRLARLYGSECSLTLGAGALGGATASIRLPFRASFAGAE